MKRFKLAIVGGTFDRFHKGHEALLSKALAVADRVLVGVTDDKMAGKKRFPTAIGPFSKRKKSAADYLAQKHYARRCKITKIHDASGPVAAWKKADAIVVTKGTLPGARKINEKRKKAGLPAAAIIICPFVMAKDGRRISSTRIRLGQMNRRGEVFLSGRKFAKPLALPASLAPALRRPFGVLFSEPDAARKAVVWPNEL
jgi:pantetheine-phosphate adenylyltransferase